MINTCFVRATASAHMCPQFARRVGRGRLQRIKRQHGTRVFGGAQVGQGCTGIGGVVDDHCRDGFAECSLHR